jgi:5-methylcytosine-specific restriction endonuclease McrA
MLWRCIQLATFHIGEKPHPSVLPQRRALESMPADNLWGEDETGHRRREATGVEHDRGETHSPASASGRHPEPPQCGDGASSRKAALYVFVLDRRGEPLQPCHPARARKLLEAKRAVVVRHTPFVIRLKDRAADESHVPGVELGVDPGSKFTGMAAFVADDGIRTGLFAIELEHRGALIRRKMEQRAKYRGGRRSRNLRHRKPRFSNRARSSGWLPPSLKHRVDTAVSWVARLRRWSPVTAVHVERVAFDMHALATGREMSGVEYQQGTLHGFEVREYLLDKWTRRCAYCGATAVPLNIDHVHPRSRGGSNRISNLVVACVPCNQSKGADSIEVFLAGRPSVLARINSQLIAPMQDAAAVNSTRQALWSRLVSTGLPVHVASGGRTKWNRRRNGLPKTHSIDALCVGEMDTVASRPRFVLAVAATGRGSYCRTRTDKHGFPRLRMPRVKVHHGYQTGDLVRAAVPTGKLAGVHVGRVAVRSTGSCNIRTQCGLVQGIHHRHLRRLQRADGYGYQRKEEGVGQAASIRS